MVDRKLPDYLTATDWRRENAPLKTAVRFCIEARKSPGLAAIAIIHTINTNELDETTRQRLVDVQTELDFLDEIIDRLGDFGFLVLLGAGLTSGIGLLIQKFG